VRFKHHYFTANINGQWFHNGQPTQIRLNRNGKSFFLINEMGQTTIGFINGNTFTLPSLNVVGQLSRRGDQIRWSNNTIWYRN
jgi:hypothetical protein